MLSLNFYKVRTGIDIRPIKQGGDIESQARLDQIIQTISQKAELEFISEKIFILDEINPTDLGAYEDEIVVYIFIFGIDKTRSSWTAHLLNQEFGNMIAPKTYYGLDIQEWIGGLTNNISCQGAFFDLRPKKKKNKTNGNS